ncbi:glycoside hydrolase [Fistulina hepatica ATCC 64428]|uniref:Glycoside hydrolase n=1 Tax=Fistulina hepatica ATCC 64428 TaxID=1128425 RepID=A0A0D7A3Z1_9AGAR|nr:glycoside hydrolase [Fistulina hepatica ATCC 64428]
MQLTLLPFTTFATLVLIGLGASAAPAKRCALRSASAASAIASSTASATASASTSSSSSTSGNSSGLVATGWYPGWRASEQPSSALAWDKYTAMTFAFATTTADSSTLDLLDEEDTLTTFVSQAKENGVSAILSVGGWTGSQYFSTNVGSAANRTNFMNAIFSLVSEYDLDGIDFDWEYPNGGTTEGIGCNTGSSDDLDNFLTFLQLLRANSTGASLILTAAVSIKPWNDASGEPSTNVSAFADVLDHIAIMAYDIYGKWSSTVGPNAPLNDSCATTSEQVGSDISAVAAWTAAGFPVDQIVLGIPGYGHSFYVNESDAFTSSGTLALYPTFDAALQPMGDSADDTSSSITEKDICGNVEGITGVFNFWGMVDGGFLSEDGSPATGIDYVYDNCSQTPFVYNSTSHVMISYDNAESFKAKGDYIKSAGLAGFALWDTVSDYNNILLDAITSVV